MYIWLLGVSGQLGSEIAFQLKKKKIPFLATNSTEANICSYEELYKFAFGKGFTHIVNCAAYSKVDLAENESALADMINAAGVENLGKVATRLHIKVMHFSTDYVFDGEKRRPYLESDFAFPINVYGSTKLKGEKLLLAEHPSSCIIRTSWLFGANGPNFISKMLDLLQKNQEVRVVFDQIGRPTFCKDLAKAAICLFDQSGIFHFANRGSSSWYEFAKFICEEAKRLNKPIACQKILPVSSQEFSSLARRPLYSVLDTKKIEKHLGFKPRHWREAVRDYMETIA